MAYSIIQKSQLEGALRIDAEYYQPEYLESNTMLSHWKLKNLNDVCGVTDGNHSTISENFVEKGLRYLRGKDLNEFFVSDNDPAFIPESFYQKLKRSHIFKNDVLVSIVGTVGMVGIVAHNYGELTGNCKIAILHPKSIDPWFLSVFLISKYGQHQIQRKVAGAVQMGIVLKDLNDILVPIIENNLQQEISTLAKRSFEEKMLSEKFYIEAEELLLERLGLKNAVFEEESSYVVNFSDISNANRMDAEYFQPKYHEIIEKVEEYKGGFDLVKNQFKQNKSLSKKDKDYYNYIEISDVNVSNGEIMPNKIAKKEIPANGKVSLCENDLLISKVRPYRGAVSFIDFEAEDLLGSGAFTVLQEKSTYKKEVLMIFFKLDCIKDLLLRYNCGTSYPVIKDEDILNLKIPLIKPDVQKKIAELVRKSHEARKKSKQLLEEAKMKVEKMIEKGGDS